MPGAIICQDAGADIITLKIMAIFSAIFYLRYRPL